MLQEHSVRPRMKHISSTYLQYTGTAGYAFRVVVIVSQ